MCLSFLQLCIKIVQNGEFQSTFRLPPSTWTQRAASKQKRFAAMLMSGVSLSMSFYRYVITTVVVPSKSKTAIRMLLRTNMRLCFQKLILKNFGTSWKININSTNNFTGRSFLCLPSDPDHILQADLEHEHLLHDEEHFGDCVAVLQVDSRPDWGGGISGGREGEGEKGKEGSGERKIGWW